MQINWKIVIKKVKKLQKLINEVQKKTKQNRKKQKVYFMSESIEYAHRKCETVNTKKIKQGGNIDILFIILK